MPYFKLGMDQKVIVPYREYLDAMKPDAEYIGDTAEITDLVRCLFLPNANSVKLVGKRGVGITSLVDGLVLHQQDDFMPDEMMMRPIFRLNGNNLFNTSDNKVIEARFQSALDELKQYAQTRQVKPVLVIDNGGSFAANAPQHVLNSLVEAIVVADYVDAVIGVDEKKEAEFNKKHPEFSASFTTKKLEEPSQEKIADILEFHARKHAQHGVIISRETLEYIVDITTRFKGMYETAQPNRSIRLLDSAATAFRMDIHSRPPGILEKQNRLLELQAELESDPSVSGAIEALEFEITEATEGWEKHRAEIKDLQGDIRKFDIMIAEAELKIKELDDETISSNANMIRKHLTSLEDGHEDLKGKRQDDVLKLDDKGLLHFAGFDLNMERNPQAASLQTDIQSHTTAVTRLHEKLRAAGEAMKVEEEMPTSFVDQIASAETKAPVGGISGTLKKNLINGVSLMKESVFGQDHVVEPIIGSLRKAAAGLNDPNRPLGVFLIPGKPGVGKTYLGEQLGEKIFGSPDFVARIDMENYREKHTISGLIGAPPGYAGYGEKGKLIDIAQRMPFGVLILDEIEKAHPDVLQTLLKVIGSGELKAPDGEEADFRNIVIIAPSNYAQDVWLDNDFETGQDLLMQRLRTGDKFSPEFVDRLDGVLCAGPLDQKALVNIAAKQVKTLQETISRNTPELIIDMPRSEIEQFIDAECIGASGRRVKREIDQAIGNPLTDILLANSKAKGTFAVSYDEAKGQISNAYDPEKVANDNAPEAAAVIGAAPAAQHFRKV